MQILEVAPVLCVPSLFPCLSPSCQRQITITSMCHRLQVSRFSQQMPTISMAWILTAPLPPSWLRTVSMLWREEKTEGVRRSAAVSMNGGYSPRQLPQAHTGAGLGRPLSFILPGAVQASISSTHSDSHIVDSSRRPPVCTFVAGLLSTPKGEVRGSAGVGSRPQEHTTSSSRWNRSRRPIMTVSMNTQTQVVLVN